MKGVDPSFLTTAEVEALAWVDRVTSGDATEGDLAALAQWRGRNDAHRRAFADAVRLRRLVATHAGMDASVTPAASGTLPSRRMVLGGAFVTAAVGYMAVRPPLGLWPSLDMLRADYRTIAGQSARIDMDNARIELNTRTALALAPGGVRLVTGELAADILPGRVFGIAAGHGRIDAQGSRINVVNIGDGVCVTCLGGTARVAHADGGSRTLGVGTQVRYADDGIGAVEAADLRRVAAWRSGLLIFRDEPLSGVVAEVNRYRDGRIVLADAAAGARTFNGVFRIDRIDDVVEQIRSVANLGAIALPGGVLVLQ